MLQFGSAYGRPVTYRVTNFQTASRVRHTKEWVVQQKKRQEETNPPVPR